MNRWEKNFGSPEKLAEVMVSPRWNEKRCLLERLYGIFGYATCEHCPFWAGSEDEYRCSGRDKERIIEWLKEEC